jgi:hypothetical protein
MIPGPNFKYVNSKTKVELTCPNGSGEYYQLIGSIYDGHGCPCIKCNKFSKPTKEDEIYAKILECGRIPGPNFKYVNNKTKIELTCPNGSGEYYQLMNSVIRGNGCPCTKCNPFSAPTENN